MARTLNSMLHGLADAGMCKAFMNRQKVAESSHLTRPSMWASGLASEQLMLWHEGDGKCMFT